MSDTVSKADFDRLNSQFMTLQRELELARKKPDASAVFHALRVNPVGTLRQNGWTEDAIEHARQVFIADKLGTSAPMQMQIAANQGPIMAQVQQLTEMMQSLADKVNNTSTAHSQYTEREKFKSAVTNASKNPNLAKAYAKNPEKWLAALNSHGGTAEDFIAKQEGELKEIAEALGIPQKADPAAGTPAASENAEKQGEGKNATIASAQSGLLNDVPVPKSQQSPNGKWDKNTFSGLKERLVAQANKAPGDR